MVICQRLMASRKVAAKAVDKRPEISEMATA
jgi:hypothetical protein